MRFCLKLELHKTVLCKNQESNPQIESLTTHQEGTEADWDNQLGQLCNVQNNSEPQISKPAVLHMGSGGTPWDPWDEHMATRAERLTCDFRASGNEKT